MQRFNELRNRAKRVLAKKDIDHILKYIDAQEKYCKSIQEPLRHGVLNAVIEDIEKKITRLDEHINEVNKWKAAYAACAERESESDVVTAVFLSQSSTNEITKLRQENDRLKQENAELQKIVKYMDKFITDYLKNHKEDINTLKQKIKNLKN